jgi:TPR repeat protein
MQEQGESPELLGALVRAYVNLGVLSETHWHTTHKAYKARALIYAQRLVVRQKSDAWSLWHRAYAWALVGLHSDALADIVAAKAARKGETTPPWVPLIDAYCKYDLPALRVATTEESAPELNWLLAYLATLSAGTPHLTIEMGLKSVAAVPRCYRIYDDLSTIGGVALHHETTVRGLLIFGETLYGDLSTLKDSPSSVAIAIEQIIPQLKTAAEKVEDNEDDANGRVLRELSLRSGLVSALIDAEPNDTAEPSTGALAHLIVEENFKQVWSRARFLYRELGVPTTGFLTIVEPIVERHPYRGLLAAFNTDDLERQSLTESVRQVRTDIYESQQRPLQDEIGESDFQKAVELNKYMDFNRDVVTRDVEFFSVNDSPNNSLSGKWFSAISPHSPRGIACRIEAITFIEAENERGKWSDWEKQFHSFPIVLRTLAEAYLKENKTADAERCLVDYVKSSPEYWAFQTLADIYQARGETDRWRETLETFLEHPSYGLEPARVRVTLADHFMERGEWDRAVEYADAAAQTGAAWAMLCASQCHEARGDWEESEEWVRLTSERYRGQGTKWYDWCLRTGRGDREPARELAIAAASRLVQTNDSGWFLKLGLYHLVDGDDPRAQSMFKTAYERAGGAYVGMQVVLLSDVLKKLDDRNNALKAVLEAPAADAPDKTMPDEFIEFASLLRKLPLDQTFRPSAADVDALVERAEPTAKSNIAYFMGRWSKLAGDLDEAKRYFAIAATHGHPDQQSRVHARILLSQLDQRTSDEDAEGESTAKPSE